MKAIKPKFYSIGCGGYTIVYKCGKCGRLFNMADSEFFYCPKCGSIIDWGVVIKVNEEFASEYLSACEPYYDEIGEWHSEKPRAQEMRNYIDNINVCITDGEKRTMPMTELTKRKIIKSNIGYYIGQGWTKKELIEKGFFTEEDFGIYEEKE